MKQNTSEVKESVKQVGKEGNIISITEVADKKKRKTTIFFRRHIKRNKVVQVMALGVHGKNKLWKGNANGTVKGDFDNAEDVVSLIGSFRYQKIDCEGLFFSLHKPNDQYIAKANNCLLASNLQEKGDFLKNQDINWLSYLYIDIDPKDKIRPVSDEKNAACKVGRDKIDEYLVSIGFPEAIRLNSGNGASLLIRVTGFRNDPKSLEKVKLFLEWLDKKYNCDNFSIDRQVGNPARSCRIPYTINGKKSGGATVKNRYSEIDSMPETVVPLAYEKFEKIFEQLGIDSPSEINIEVEQNRKVNVPRYLNHYNIKAVKEKDQNGATLYCLDECLFDPSHSPNNASIVQQPNGKLSYQCFHDSCGGKTWHDARKKISGDDELTDFIDGAGLPARGAINQYEDVRVIGMEEVMACKRTSQPLITDFLNEGEACLLVGSSGVGKSALTLGMCLAGATKQKPTWGLTSFDVRKTFATLFVQSENSIVHTKNRMDLIFKHNRDLKIGKDRIFLLGRGDDCMLTGELSNPSFQALLIDSMIECNAEVLVVDPLISFHNRNENDNAEMRKELDCLKNVGRIAGASIILVHHAAKGHTAENKGGRGASAIPDWADRIIFVERVSKEGKELLLLTCQKSRNSVPFTPYYIDITDFKFERVSSPGDEKTDFVMKALDELGGVATTQDELANKIIANGDVSMSTAKRYIKQAVQAGLIEETGKGKAKGYKSLELADE